MADAQPTFDLFRLPPELRNNIYRELLVLNNSFTCHPQILCASRTIIREASNILYRDNLIEIKVFRDGVYVQGKKRGNYKFDLPHGVQGLWKGEDKLIWPNFIRRVQFVRLSVESSKEPARHATNWIPGIGSLHYIVYSLPAFLQKGHKLRSLEVELTQLRDLFARNRVLMEFNSQVGIALCPLRLLSSIKNLQVEGTSADLDVIRKAPDDVSEAAYRFLSASRGEIIKRMYSTELVTQSIIKNGHRTTSARYWAVFSTWGAIPAV